jgi:hypothetical protein
MKNLIAAAALIIAAAPVVAEQVIPSSDSSFVFVNSYTQQRFDLTLIDGLDKMDVAALNIALMNIAACDAGDVYSCQVKMLATDVEIVLDMVDLN